MIIKKGNIQFGDKLSPTKNRFEMRIILIFWFLFLGSVHPSSSTVIDGSSDPDCPTSDTSCKINCIGTNACGSTSSAFYGGGSTLHCPTNLDCDYCELYCDGYQSCQSAIVYGYYCNFMNVTFGDGGHDPGRRMKIYAPGNGGSLLVDMPETSSTNSDDTIKDAIIYDNSTYGGTNEIIVNCRASSNDECENLVIWAKHSNYLELNCFDDTNCNTMTVYCPTNSTLKESNQIPCVFDCTDDPNNCQIDAYIESSSWSDDIDFTCSGTDSNGYDICTGLFKVLCDNGADSCIMTSSNTCNGGNQGCQPTRMPTVLPTQTLAPSNVPSRVPTNKPTSLPTRNPSALPTKLPTSLPTGLPSSEPSSPTMNPTNKPTSAPISEPTNMPVISTLAPSNVPSNRPTNMPTNDDDDDSEEPNATDTNEIMESTQLAAETTDEEGGLGFTKSSGSEMDTPVLIGLCFFFYCLLVCLECIIFWS